MSCFYNFLKKFTVTDLHKVDQVMSVLYEDSSSFNQEGLADAVFMTCNFSR